MRKKKEIKKPTPPHLVAGEGQDLKPAGMVLLIGCLQAPVVGVGVAAAGGHVDEERHLRRSHRD